MKLRPKQRIAFIDGVHQAVCWICKRKIKPGKGLSTPQITKKWPKIQDLKRLISNKTVFIFVFCLNRSIFTFKKKIFLPLSGNENYVSPPTLSLTNVLGRRMGYIKIQITLKKQNIKGVYAESNYHICKETNSYDARIQLSNHV